MTIINKINNNFTKQYKKYKEFTNINYQIQFDEQFPDIIYMYNNKKQILKAQFQFIGLYKNNCNNWVWANIITGVNKNIIKIVDILKNSSHLFEKLENTQSQFYHQFLTNDSLYIIDNIYLKWIEKLIIYITNGLFIIKPTSNKNYTQYILITNIISK